MDHKGLIDDLRLIRLNAGIRCLDAALTGDNKTAWRINDFELEVHAFVRELTERSRTGKQ